jgi:eukaryotic-like serine/threonine-protein kinase
MAVRKVGTSRIVREIGRGGMAVVYEAFQEALDRRVAVKVLEAGQARSKESTERFLREGRAYAHLHHASVLAVYDLIEKDDALYLITEFVDGADLHQVVQAGGALPPDGVAAVGAQVADALEFIHARALFHRDVKPANVMISREGDVKVMDFGIARDPLAAQLTSTGVVVGTPAYVAPEVLCGDEADERSEVWSLGISLYELATGVLPFQAKDFNALFAQVRKARPKRVRDLAPDVPRRLAKAIERCIEKNPEARWQTAGALARELRACASSLLGNVLPHERLAALLVERGLGGKEPVGPTETVELVETTGSAAPSTGSARQPVPVTREVVAAGIPERRTGRWILVLLLLAAAGVAAWNFGRWSELLLAPLEQGRRAGQGPAAR